MPIDYYNESQKYRPAIIKTLLIAEAPPPSGKVYFYVPRKMSLAKSVRDDRNLAATIFNHYFGKRPENEHEYIDYLQQLQAKGVFLIDLCDDPIKVRGCPQGILRIKREILTLREKIRKRGITISEKNIVFLLARGNYQKDIRKEFPESRQIRWIDFRMSN
jgi:hypothetical protein